MRRIRKLLSLILVCVFVMTFISGCVINRPSDGTEPDKSGFKLTSPANIAKNQPISPTFTWETAENATSYKLTVATNTSFTEGVIERLNVVSPYTLDTELDYETLYYWKIDVTEPAAKACDAVFLFTTVAAPEVSVGDFALVTPADNAENQAILPVFSWGAAENASGYKLTVATDLNFTKGIIERTNIVSPYSIDTPLNNSVLYYWKVETIAPKVKRCERVFTFTTAEPDVVIPTIGRFSLTAPANNAVNQPFLPQFKWGAAENALNYKLTIATNSSFTQNVIEKSNVTSPYTLDTALSGNALYYWRIEVTAPAAKVCDETFSFTTTYYDAWSVDFDRIASDAAGSGTVAQVNNAFGGIGFEWDAYDAPDVCWPNAGKSSDSVYEFLSGRAGIFKPSKVRLKLDIEKLIPWGSTTWFSGDHTTVPNFDWSLLTAKQILKVLDYCQANNIQVAIGLFGTRDQGMKWINDYVPSEGHKKYAQFVIEMVYHLVETKGYNCIKYIIPYNEPNYISMTDRKKDNGTVYANSSAGRLEMWTDCVNNLIGKLSAKPQSFKDKVSLAASDVSTTGTTHTGNSGTYLAAAMNYKANIGIFETHNYNSYANIVSGKFTATMKNHKDYVVNNAGAGAKYWLYEGGFLDGKIETGSAINYDTNQNLNGENGTAAAYTYGVNIADYILQGVLGGLDGLVFWSFDKQMHFNYNGTDYARTGARDWGMVDSATQSSRPWFYTTSLMSRVLRPGIMVYRKEAAATRGHRSVYVTDGEKVFAIAVNNYDNASDGTREFKFPSTTPLSKNKVYVYLLGPNNVVDLDTNGCPKPAQVLVNNFNEGFTLQIPQGTMAVISQEPLF